METKLINPVSFTREVPGVFSKLERCIDGMDTFMNIASEIHESAQEQSLDSLSKTQSEVATIVKTAAYQIQEIQTKAVSDIKALTDEYDYIFD